VGEVVEADLRTVCLPEEAFDVAHRSFVLEHVAGAEEVLDKLVESLRPGGLLIVRIPERDSVYGFVTRHTPHSTHVAFKRYVKGQRNAGKPGFGPYPVVYDDVISKSGITAYCGSQNLHIESLTGSNFHLNVFPRRLRPLVDLALRGVARLSFGRLSASHNNLCLIARKAPADAGTG
jgi:SAM-dependent methyltransferase